MLVPEELIQRARGGDAGAFREIVLAYSPRVRNTISRITADPAQSDALASLVFLRVRGSLDQLGSARIFEPWLYRITVNASYGHLRKRMRPD